MEVGHGRWGWLKGKPTFHRSEKEPNAGMLIRINVIGTTCRMRIYADKLVAAHSDADFRRIVSLIVANSDENTPEGRENYARLKEALTNENKIASAGYVGYGYGKTEKTRLSKRIERRTKHVDDIIVKAGLKKLWEEL